MVFLDIDQIVEIVSRIVIDLKQGRVEIFDGKISRDREDRQRKVLILYVPSSLDVRSVVNTLRYLVSLLRSQGIENAVLYYKPDLFTYLGIYSGHSKLKSYIYLYKMR